MTQAEIRSRLQALGFDPLAPAGLAGAVRAFQRTRPGLKVDGDPGPKTQAALKLALAACKPEPFALAGALTLAALRKISPFGRPEILAAVVAAAPAMEAAGINTPLRLAHFLAQIAHETGGFGRLEESLNYSAARLCQVWPKRFPTLGAAQPYALKPQALAIKVYGGRLGNRPAPSLDGWTFRGSGGIMTTGAANYADAGHRETPEALREPGPAMAAAVLYWRKRGCNAPADRDDIDAVSIAVNGGTIGLAERKAYLAASKRAIGA